MFFYYLLLVFVYFFAVHFKEKRTSFEFFVIFLLILIAGFRDGNICRDYAVYLDCFKYPQNSIVREPTFRLIVSIIKSFGSSSVILFFIYSILGVTIKYFGIKELTPLVFLSLTIYVSDYFLMQEMTAIRAGIASGLLLLLIKPLHERKILKYFCICFIAILFHFSALLFIPLYFIQHQKFEKWYIFLVPICIILHLLNLHFSFLLYLLPIEFIPAKLGAMQDFAETSNFEAYINLLNPYLLFKLTFLYFFIVKIEFFKQHNEYFYTLMKIYILGYCLYFLFADFPVMAGRMNSLLSIVEIIIFPQLVYLFKKKERNVEYFLVFIVGIIFLTVNLFFIHLIKPYESLLI